jgi:murein tripeptide amidase MpaA
VHGDEAIPPCSWPGSKAFRLTPEQLAGYQRYRAILDRRTPDFQVRRGYPESRPGQGNLAMSTNQVAERFGAVAMTLEMPFKDNADLPTRSMAGARNAASC